MHSIFRICSQLRSGPASNRYSPGPTSPKSKRPVPSVLTTFTGTCRLRDSHCLSSTGQSFKLTRFWSLMSPEIRVVARNFKFGAIVSFFRNFSHRGSSSPRAVSCGYGSIHIKASINAICMVSHPLSNSGIMQRSSAHGYCLSQPGQNFLDAAPRTCQLRLCSPHPIC
jgi:hypothetical protein